MATTSSIDSASAAQMAINASLLGPRQADTRVGDEGLRALTLRTDVACSSVEDRRKRYVSGFVAKLNGGCKNIMATIAQTAKVWALAGIFTTADEAADAIQKEHSLVIQQMDPAVFEARIDSLTDIRSILDEVRSHYAEYTRLRTESADLARILREAVVNLERMSAVQSRRSALFRARHELEKQAKEWGFVSSFSNCEEDPLQWINRPLLEKMALQTPDGSEAELLNAVEANDKALQEVLENVEQLRMAHEDYQNLKERYYAKQSRLAEICMEFDLREPSRHSTWTTEDWIRHRILQDRRADVIYLRAAQRSQFEADGSFACCVKALEARENIDGYMARLERGDAIITDKDKWQFIGIEGLAKGLKEQGYDLEAILRTLGTPPVNPEDVSVRLCFAKILREELKDIQERILFSPIAIARKVTRLANVAIATRELTQYQHATVWRPLSEVGAEALRKLDLRIQNPYPLHIDHVILSLRTQPIAIGANGLCIDSVQLTEGQKKLVELLLKQLAREAVRRDP